MRLRLYLVKIVERVELATQDFDEAFAGAGLLDFLANWWKSGLGMNQAWV